MRRYPRDKRDPIAQALHPKPLRPTLEEKIAANAAATRDTSNAENHPHIAVWHRHVLKDYENWGKKNGK